MAGLPSSPAARTRGSRPDALVTTCLDALVSVRRRALDCARALTAAKRIPPLILAHGALIAVANYAAWWLRFDGAIPSELLLGLALTLPWVVLVRLVTFVPFGLYSGLWRYTGIWDLWRIVLAVFTSSAILYVALYRELGPGIYPRSIVIIDSLLLVCLPRRAERQR